MDGKIEKRMKYQLINKFELSNKKESKRENYTKVGLMKRKQS